MWFISKYWHRWLIFFSTKPLIHQSEHGLHKHMHTQKIDCYRRGNLAASQQTQIKAHKL